VPVRPVDWPATTSSGWERLAATRLPAAGADGITIDAVADAGTSGLARVLLAGARVGEDLPVTTEPGRHTIPLAGTGVEAEIAVEARVTAGGGAVRVAAVLVP
jgi:hypothetical protein